MYVIQDQIHCEDVGDFDTREAAMAELVRLAGVPWGVAPNRPPCMSSATCERNYELIEYDTAPTPWRALSRQHVLQVSAKGSIWLLES